MLTKSQLRAVIYIALLRVVIGLSGAAAGTDSELQLPVGFTRVTWRKLTVGPGGNDAASKQLDKAPQRRQLELLSTYSFLNSSTDVLHLRPSVWGRFNKPGPAFFPDWAHNKSNLRMDSFLSWRLNKAIADAKGAQPRHMKPGGLQCAYADHPPTSYPGCQVYINHK
jgi:hypothetical protein